VDELVVRAEEIADLDAGDPPGLGVHKAAVEPDVPGIAVRDPVVVRLLFLVRTVRAPPPTGQGDRPRRNVERPLDVVTQLRQVGGTEFVPLAVEKGGLPRPDRHRRLDPADRRGSPERLATVARGEHLDPTSTQLLDTVAVPL
jgi:hypothetical protein